MLIDRPFYTDRLTECIDDRAVKILTGARRSGKSCIMKLLAERIKNEKNIGDENIIFISFDYNGNEDLDSAQVYSDLCEMMVEGETNYIFLDEVQSITGWKNLIFRLHQKDNCRIVLSCSGFTPSSIEKPSRLPFRHTVIHVFPLSYSEYKEFTSRTDDLHGYLRHGGFPSLYSYEMDPDEELNAIKDISSSCIYLDLVKRHQIRKADQLDKVFNYFLKNTGVPSSAYSISCSLKFGGKKPDNETVGGYIQKLVDSSLVHSCPRFDMVNFEVMKTQEKYYPVDLALKKTVTYESESVKTELECAVFTELLRRGYSVYVGKYPDMEIKFIAKTKESTVFIQCSDQLTDKDIEALNRVPDKSSKRFAITMNPDQTGTIDGIEVVSADQFLSGTELVAKQSTLETEMPAFDTASDSSEEFIPVHLL